MRFGFELFELLPPKRLRSELKTICKETREFGSVLSRRRQVYILNDGDVKTFEGFYRQ